MTDLLQTVLSTPLANLLIVASLGFLFISVSGSVAGKIEPGRAGRIMAGVVGVGLLGLGISLPFLISEPASKAGTESVGAAAVQPTSDLNAERERLAAQRTRLAAERLRLEKEAQAREEGAGQGSQAEQRPQLANLSGTLLIGTTNRAPLRNARIELRVPGASDAVYVASTDAAGNFAFRGIRAGDYEIRVEGPKQKVLTLIAPKQARLTLPPATNRKITLTVTR